MTHKTWLITGAGRGLGARLAQTVLAAGDNVVVTARDSEAARAAFTAHTDRLLLQTLDITDATGPQRVVNAAVERFGGLDVLVNNAGYGHLGLFEEATEEDIQRQLETNVSGMMRMTRAVLPTLRRQRAGHIINIGSIAGLAAFDFCTLYGTSKFAVEGFSINLSRDLAPFGVHVTVVEPGYFRTDFLDASSVRYSANPIADYDDVREQTEAVYQGYNHKQPGSPAKFGPAILRLANEKTPPLHLLLGSDALAVTRKALTERLAEIDAWESLSLTTDHDDDVAG